LSYTAYSVGPSSRRKATIHVCSSRVRDAMLTSAPAGAAASSALKSASSCLSKKRRSVRA